MKIISKYSDYYDSAMGQGIDTSLIYKREGALDAPIESYICWSSAALCSQEFTKMSRYFGRILNPEYFAGSWWSGTAKNKNLHNYARALAAGIRETIASKYLVEFSDVNIIGFCGKIYITYELRISTANSDKHWDITVANKENKYFNMMPKKQQDRVVVGEVNDIFRGNVDDIFLHFGCPIFWIRPINYHNRISLIRNPILKDLGFPAILDPYTAFQEISMYMGSVFAKSEPSMEDISDESMTEAKGFDKWSFRKLPTKKR